MPEQPPAKLHSSAPMSVSPARPAPPIRAVELHCKTNFSFLEGASHPDELVYQAATLGYAGLAITDRNSVAGVVRAHIAAKQCGLKLIIGAEVTTADASPVLLWAMNREGYGRLCRLLTRGRRLAPKGECHLTFADIAEHSSGLLLGVLLPSAGEPSSELSQWRDIFRDRTYAVAELHRGPCDERRLSHWQRAAQNARVPLIAILCQGRGSAANSAVCYCLGITAVDPAQSIDLLFERFISAERNEPPDIDVDFEHERREEVIQYIYERYGRDRAGIAATVICYRRAARSARSARRWACPRTSPRARRHRLGLVGRGLPTSRCARPGSIPPIRGCARRSSSPRADRLPAPPVAACRRLRHHRAAGSTRWCRSSNAAMEDRTVIEWDKDDIDALGMLKVDVLALGMLTCIRRGFDLIEQHYGERWDARDIPQEDPRSTTCCSAPIRSACSRSRAARRCRCCRGSSPRLLRPRHRGRDRAPGPIQGDMVHPYLRRREGEGAGRLPLPLRARRTSSKRCWQDARRAAVPGAGDADRHRRRRLHAAEADRLRRAMATFKRTGGTIASSATRFIGGMVARGYAATSPSAASADRGLRRIRLSREPRRELRAARLRLGLDQVPLPRRLRAALLNSQPMGFYAPAQIVRDAREHGVEVRPVDVRCPSSSTGRWNRFTQYVV
jgi:DNA polymerase III alpha subunit